MILITIAFVVFLTLIVIVANLGLGTTYFPFMYGVPGGDKLGHFLLIGILSFLVNYVLKTKRIKILSRFVLLGNIIVLVIVTIEEITQIFLIYRAFSIMDLVFDYLGIFVFGYLADKIYKRHHRHKGKESVNLPAKDESG